MKIETREVVSVPERRIVAEGIRVERREGAEGSKSARIVGHASVFDSWTTLYEGRFYLWREIIRPGAYKNAIKEEQDVRALWNHDANYVLGRTKSGTLRLSEDKVGLLTETDPPDTQTIRDLVLSPIERGDVSGMSFAFTVRRGDKMTQSEEDGVTILDSGGERVTIREEGERTIEEREILDVDLYDISPVTYPAYEATDVALRALGAQQEQRFLRGRRAGRLTRMHMRSRLAEARLSQ